MDTYYANMLTTYSGCLVWILVLRIPKGDMDVCHGYMLSLLLRVWARNFHAFSLMPPPVASFVSFVDKGLGMFEFIDAGCKYIVCSGHIGHLLSISVCTLSVYIGYVCSA